MDAMMLPRPVLVPGVGDGGAGLLLVRLNVFAAGWVLPSLPGLFWCVVPGATGDLVDGGGFWKTGGADVAGTTTGTGVFFVTTTVLV